jgi:hypothetical protein
LPENISIFKEEVIQTLKMVHNAGKGWLELGLWGYKQVDVTQYPEYAVF